MASLFLALTPEEDLDRKLIELKSKQKEFLIEGIDLNWSKDHQHHITLNYIGPMEPEQKEEMLEKLDACSFPYKELPIKITSLSYFPKENGKVVVANIFLSNQLQKLYDKTEEIVSRIGFGIPLRIYRPHISLARFKHKSRPFSHFLEINEPITSSVFSIDVYESIFLSGKSSHSLIKSKSFD